MTLRQDIDNSIDAMKASTDARFPNLPEPRKTSSDIRQAFDDVYAEMRTISDMTMDATESRLASLEARPVFSGSYTDLTEKPASFIPSAHTHVINDISNASNIGKSILSASDASSVRSLIGAGASSFSGAYGDLSGIPSSFAPSAHTHVINDISNAGTTGKSIIAAANAGAVRSAIFTPATAITNSATNAPVDAATNAPTNSKTDYNALTTLLGALVDGLNATNTAQNAGFAIVNANAAKQNAGFSIVNLLAAKQNLSLDIFRNNGMLTA